jgi:hypothetical protein
MPTKLSLLGVVSTLLVLSTSRADDGAARAEPRVDFDVVIAEQSAPAASGDMLQGESGEETLARIRELDAQGKLTALTRVHLSARSGGTTSVQLGDRSATGGRGAAAGDRGRGGLPEGFGGRAADPSETATVVQGTPSIDTDGTITLQLQVEKTRIEDRDADGAVSSRVITVSANTDVSLGDGETVIAHSFSGRTQEGVAGDREQRYVIVVTAHIAGSKTHSANVSHAADRELHVFTLHNSAATDVADTLKKVIPMQDVRVVVDSRSNSLLVAAPDKVLEAVRELLRVMGEGGRNQPETP